MYFLANGSFIGARVRPGTLERIPKQCSEPISRQHNNDAVTGQGEGGAPMTQVNYPWDRGGNTCPRSSLTGLGNKCPQHSTKESNWAAAGLWQAESCSCKVSVSVRLHQKKGGGLKETKQSVSASVSGHVSSCDRCFGTQAVVLYHT